VRCVRHEHCLMIMYDMTVLYTCMMDVYIEALHEGNL
jgi:hypothetical protein